ncbi:MAG: cytochrome c-type biosis protein [Chloroflexota bacterium]|nr:cytochrome c-type biosis protein [Chloroflexota bacterium]
MVLSLATAFAGGLLSFLSPCVIALVPGYIAYLGGAGVEGERSRAGLVANAALFVVGFSAAFVTLFGIFKVLVISLPFGYKDLFAQVAAVLVIILGLQFLGLFRIPFLAREARFQLAHRLPGGRPSSALVVGVAFGLGWTPCVGPVLTFIISRAVAQDVLGGVGLMLVYCAGLAIPFFAVALLMERVRPVLRAVNRRARLVEGISGAMLVVVGVLIFTGQFAQINQLFGPIAKYLPQG